MHIEQGLFAHAALYFSLASSQHCLLDSSILLSLKCMIACGTALQHNDMYCSGLASCSASACKQIKKTSSDELIFESSVMKCLIMASFQ